MQLKRRGNEGFLHLNLGYMLEFNDLIKSLKVVSVPITGCTFNWFKLDGNAMIRLDRFQLMDGLLNL